MVPAEETMAPMKSWMESESLMAADEGWWRQASTPAAIDVVRMSASTRGNIQSSVFMLGSLAMSGRQKCVVPYTIIGPKDSSCGIGKPSKTCDTIEPPQAISKKPAKLATALVVPPACLFKVR